MLANTSKVRPDSYSVTLFFTNDFPFFKKKLSIHLFI